jgi:hypothetical protein
MSMGSGDAERLSVLQIAFAIAVKQAGPAQKLEEIVDNAIAITGADKGYLIVSTRKDRFAIQIARNHGYMPVPQDQQLVSRTLLENAGDMNDTVVACSPWVELRLQRMLRGRTHGQVPPGGCGL